MCQITSLSLLKRGLKRILRSFLAYCLYFSCLCLRISYFSFLSMYLQWFFCRLRWILISLWYELVAWIDREHFLWRSSSSILITGNFYRPLLLKLLGFCYTAIYEAVTCDCYVNTIVAKPWLWFLWFCIESGSEWLLHRCYLSKLYYLITFKPVFFLD